MGTKVCRSRFLFYLTNPLLSAIIGKKEELPMKEIRPSEEKSKTTIPIISLLLTIAALAMTSAYVLYKYTSDRSYRRKWKDYDDCGLA